MAESSSALQLRYLQVQKEIFRLIHRNLEIVFLLYKCFNVSIVMSMLMFMFCLIVWYSLSDPEFNFCGKELNNHLPSAHGDDQVLQTRSSRVSRDWVCGMIFEPWNWVSLFLLNCFVLNLMKTLSPATSWARAVATKWSLGCPTHKRPRRWPSQPPNGF